MEPDDFDELPKVVAFGHAASRGNIRVSLSNGAVAISAHGGIPSHISSDDLPALVDCLVAIQQSGAYNDH